MKYPRCFDFIELPQFTKAWDDLRLTDEDLRYLQILLLETPESGPIIAGTGGIRKLRFSLPNRGKSRSIRICYIYFREYEKLYLLALYEKKNQSNLTDEQKRILKELVKFLQNECKRTRRPS